MACIGAAAVPERSRDLWRDWATNGCSRCSALAAINSLKPISRSRCEALLGEFLRKLMKKSIGTKGVGTAGPVTGGQLNWQISPA